MYFLDNINKYKEYVSLTPVCVDPYHMLPYAFSDRYAHNGIVNLGSARFK